MRLHRTQQELIELRLKRQIDLIMHCMANRTMRLGHGREMMNFVVDKYQRAKQNLSKGLRIPKI